MCYDSSWKIFDFHLMYWYTWIISKYIQMIVVIIVVKKVIMHMIVQTII